MGNIGFFNGFVVEVLRPPLAFARALKQDASIFGLISNIFRSH